MVDRLKHVVMLLSNPFRPDPRVHKEAKALIEDGHEVTIIAWDRIGGHPLKEKVDGIQILRAGPISGFDSVRSTMTNLPKFYRNAHRLMKDMKIDIIHCHDFDTLPLGNKAARKKKAKVVYDAHESYPDMISQTASPTIVSRVRKMELKQLKKVDAAIVTTDAMRSKFEEGGARKVITVMNCAPSYPAHSPDEILALRNKLGVEDKTMMLYIGVFEKIRGMEELVDAFNQHAGDEFRLVLGGYGNIEDILKEKASQSDKVVWLGPMKPSEIPLYTQATDLMVLMSDPTSTQTKLCVANKIFEAMNAGKPIIVSRDTLHGELVEAMNAGFAITYFDDKEFFDSVRKLRDDKELYQKMSEGGKKAVTDQYNWDVMAGRLRELYKDL